MRPLYAGRSESVNSTAVGKAIALIVTGIPWHADRREDPGSKTQDDPTLFGWGLVDRDG